jgi:hypothetical protein
LSSRVSAERRDGNSVQHSKGRSVNRRYRATRGECGASKGLRSAGQTRDGLELLGPDRRRAGRVLSNQPAVVTLVVPSPRQYGTPPSYSNRRHQECGTPRQGNSDLHPSWVGNADREGVSFDDEGVSVAEPNHANERYLVEAIQRGGRTPKASRSNAYPPNGRVAS